MVTTRRSNVRRRRILKWIATLTSGNPCPPVPAGTCDATKALIA
jgi:hypothetical protein